MTSLSVYISSKRRPRIPRSFLLQAKNAVLGRSYTLSVAFISERAIRKANAEYRRKRSSTDILAFPFSPQSGEILISVKDVERRAPLFGRTPYNFLAFLFIHGLLHLKGYAHGSTMEREEIKFRRKFGI